MSSLSARLLLSVSLLLLIFFGATIVVLDIAFREAGEQAQEDILDGQLMALLAAAEPNIYGELEIFGFARKWIRTTRLILSRH